MDKQLLTIRGKTTIDDSELGTHSESEQDVKDIIKDQPMMNVGVAFSRTITTKPYENVKVHVSLNCPCLLGEQDDTFEFVKDWCDERLSTVIEEIEGDLHG